MKPPFQCSPISSASAFQQVLVKWFQENAESYPWRTTTDPYEILVSEVMLQQTTVQAVIENSRYEKFLELFPTVNHLASASEGEILRAWEGLGYYNRVRNLQKTARAVIAEHGGVFPEDLEQLLRLPGVGPYTAAAVASFAFNLSAPLVDANVYRVFSRLFNDETPVNTPAAQRVAWERAGQLVSLTHPREYNGALMELGQKVCRNKEVKCEACPVSAYCESADPLSLPRKAPKKKVEDVTEYVIWCQQKNGALLLQKGTESRRKGMWTLPFIPIEEAALLPLLHESVYCITRYKVTLKVYGGSDLERGLASRTEEMEKVLQQSEWVPLPTLESLPMPSPIRRVVTELQERLI